MAKGKHVEVTMASLKRRASAHGKLAEKHAGLAVNGTMDVETQRLHAGVAMMHTETEGVYLAEVKELQSQP